MAGVFGWNASTSILNALSLSLSLAVCHPCERECFSVVRH